MESRTRRLRPSPPQARQCAYADMHGWGTHKCSRYPWPMMDIRVDFHRCILSNGYFVMRQNWLRFSDARKSHTLDSPAKWEGKAGQMHVSCPSLSAVAIIPQTMALVGRNGPLQAPVKYHLCSISVGSQERSTRNSAMHAAWSSPRIWPAFLSIIGCLRHVPCT